MQLYSTWKYIWPTLSLQLSWIQQLHHVVCVYL